MKIYNTKSRMKENFKPIALDNKIGMYVCGVTVYDDCHIGHARTFVAFDAIVRYLKYKGYDVNFVRNITDIDDKIIARAHSLDTDCVSLANKYIASMHEDLAQLNILKPTFEPKATEFMPEMITMVQALLDAGYAYVANSGDVYYSVERFSAYKQLSGIDRSKEDHEVVSRLAGEQEKHAHADFILWKMAKAGEPHWDSPFGLGRPGWHLECSAMSNSILGKTFDLHGGGYDLISPHHENECAQSEAINKQPLANYWLHVGFLQIDAQKMSKSLNNFKTIKQVLEFVDPESLKLFLLSAHYRSFLDFSDDNINKAQRSMETLYLALRDLDLTVTYQVGNEYEQRFVAYMDDDFNTPGALSVLFDLVRVLNKTEDKTRKNSLGVIVLHLAQVLGLMLTPIEQYLHKPTTISIAEIEELISLRNKARVAKNWVEADRIRQQLKDLQILIEDHGDDTNWRVVK